MLNFLLGKNCSKFEKMTTIFLKLHSKNQPFEASWWKKAQI